MNSIIQEFIEHSPVADPNENKQLLLKWANEVYSNRNADGNFKDKAKERSLAINPRSDNDETGRDYAGPSTDAGTVDDRKVWHFKYTKYRTNEHSIPKWEVTSAELKPFYDTARLARDYEWNYKFLECFHKKMKRRLPWLYPDYGIHISLRGYFM